MTLNNAQNCTDSITFQSVSVVLLQEALADRLNISGKRISGTQVQVLLGYGRKCHRRRLQANSFMDSMSDTAAETWRMFTHRRMSPFPNRTSASIAPSSILQLRDKLRSDIRALRGRILLFRGYYVSQSSSDLFTR